MIASRNGYLRVDPHWSVTNDFRVSLMAERINVRPEKRIALLDNQADARSRRSGSRRSKQIAVRLGLSSSCFEKFMR